MSFSDYAPMTYEFFKSHIKDEDTKTYRDTGFLKPKLSVESFIQEISKKCKQLTIQNDWMAAFVSLNQKII